MTTKINLLITLLAYSIIVSQPFMYFLALKQAQLGLQFESYMEVRKLIDLAMRANLKYVIYAVLLANISLIFLTYKNGNTILFYSAISALLALVVDVLLTLKGNLPINDVINTWSADNVPENWVAFRNKWFAIFQYRQIASITGFISLLIGAVFGTKELT